MDLRIKTGFHNGHCIFRMAFLCTVLTLTGTIAPAAENDLPVRAPAALPGTTEEMLSPDFWISRIENPDKVIMTISQIGELNTKNSVRTIASDHPYAKNIASIEKDGPVFNLMNPLGLGSSFSGDEVRKRLEVNNERLAKGRFYDRWALTITDEKKAEICESVNLDNLPKDIRPRTAMIVHHTSARLYPTSEPAYRMQGYLDDNNVTSLDIGMPVAVLHVSGKGDYWFVMSPIAWGWVPAEDVAFGSPKDIGRYLNSVEFIVAVDHKMPYYADRDFSTYSGCLYMGERLTLDRKTAEGYRVRVPVREFDGSLAFKTGWIRPDAAVHEGWLPYTQRNVITMAFKLLGRPYGWHDSWDERDCGGIMRVIFNCFGFTLPRYWSFEQLCSDHATYVGNIQDKAEKNRILGSMPAGITFTGTTGHISLYLGSVDGTPYSIHQCGWNYKEGDKEYKMARVVISDYELVGFTMKSIAFFTPVMP